MGSMLTLVDAGMPGSAPTILGHIETLGRSGTDLSCMVITHHHFDRVVSLVALRARTSAQVLVHPQTAYPERPPFWAGCYC